MQDSKTGRPYYNARVIVSTQELTRMKNIKLSPGMPVDVMIITDNRTVLQYLLSPLVNSFQYAFREK